ncbi:MFS transporter [Qipengyuania atrilutea]|uniref:MFS transporter n=1 Tax=Qipengyuania atrilutea TaxID=2744473 RepID=A0A850HDC5_9SPHN|nr:MFS transporter [Actirhodobacter atriluteus]NVD45159.1 MFS transporter [Actirhodobacter atriluteus]
MRNETITGASPRRQSRRFLLLYALASAGGSASYVPLLTLLLPARVAEIWTDNTIAVLSSLLFAGALAASAGNILFGWASDRTGSRKGWIAAGLALSAILLCLMQFAESFAGLLTLIILWQFALNMMLGPLLAWAGDCIPDAQKGTLGGLLSLSPACGALAGALLTIPGLAGPDTRLVLSAGIAIVMVLPVLLFGNPVPMPQLMLDERAGAEERGVPRSAHPVARMWLARLCIQIAEAALFSFLLLWFRSVDEGLTDNFTARLFTVVLFVSVPVSLAVGRWSDRIARPILPLAICAGIASIGLAALSVAETPLAGIAGYILFGVMAGVFLSLHAGQTLRVLPRASTRGRDLGIFNLTNTVPSLIVPGLALALIPLFGFGALFILLAAFAALAALLLVSILFQRPVR